MKLDIEALAREAGKQTEREFDVHRDWLAAYTNAVLEAAARECATAGTDWIKEVTCGKCADAIRALKLTP
jgi:hypothetical protein